MSDVIGPDAFEQGMRQLGVPVNRRGNLVVADLDVPLGPHAGQTFAVAADPPSDYPRVPPHWVHLPEHINLPGGNKNASELGPGWAKWSRPHKKWVGGGSAANQWVAHVRALLATATT